MDINRFCSHKFFLGFLDTKYTLVFHILKSLYFEYSRTVAFLKVKQKIKKNFIFIYCEKS